MNRGTASRGRKGVRNRFSRPRAPVRGLTKQWSRRPTAFARTSLRLLGAAHRQRSAAMESRRSAGGRCEEMTMWYSAVGCLVTLALSLLVAPLLAVAQPAGQVPKIG